MKCRYIFFTALLILLPAPVLAESQTDIHLNASADETRVWQAEEIATTDHIRTRIHVLEQKPGKSHPPAIQFDVMSKDRDATLELAILRDGRRMIGLVTLFAGDTKLDMQKVVSPPFADEAFDVDVSWTTEGQITFEISGKIYELDMKQSVEDFAISVGSADMSIEHLDIGEANR